MSLAVTTMLGEYLQRSKSLDPREKKRKGGNLKDRKEKAQWASIKRTFLKLIALEDLCPAYHEKAYNVCLAKWRTGTPMDPSRCWHATAK